MDLEHQFSVTAPIDTAWATMMDIEGVAECFPGATLTAADGDSFEGTVKVKLGPIAMVYKGSGAFVERDDGAHRAVIEAKGRDKRGNGTAGATVTMSMVESGSETSITVVTDLNVTGKPAQFGRGVMQDVSDKLLGQFVDCLATKVGAPASPGSADSPEESAPAGGDAAAPAAPAAPGGAEPAGEAPGSDAGPPPAAAAMPASAVAGAAAASGRPPAAASPPAAAGPPPVGVTDAPPSRSGSEGTDAVGAGRGGATDALDLGAAVGPVLLRTYAPYALAGVAGLVLGWLLGRRSGQG